MGINRNCIDSLPEYVHIFQQFLKFQTNSVVNLLMSNGNDIMRLIQITEVISLILHYIDIPWYPQYSRYLCIQRN